MTTFFFEVTNEFNWGKFAVACWDLEEWVRPELAPQQCGMTSCPSLLMGRGWAPEHIWVLDLQTGEGASFLPGGLASADLHKHAIWTCPLFPHFLQWLYEQLRDCRNPVKTLEGLPKIVELNGPEVRRSMSGQRYPGPSPRARKGVKAVQEVPGKGSEKG